MRVSVFLITFLMEHCVARLLRRLSHKRQLRSRSQSHTMSSLYPFYHTSEQIHSELTDLASRCQGMTMQSIPSDDGSVTIDVINIKAPGQTPINKNFLLFGEHARELISPESGLHFIKSLCGGTDLKEKADRVLQDSEFQIVINGNPYSRKKVEQGDFCLRVNEHGVDLNRNWDEKWQADAVLDSSDTNPGTQAFSEPETKIFKSLVSDYKPTNFLTVHSGTRGMYMPWAYDMEHLATRNQPQMMQILKTLDKDYCECPFGAAGREVGYSCPGTCLDWVYDKLETPYSFAFEIYIGEGEEGDLKQRWEEKMKEDGASFLQWNNHLGHESFKNFFQDHPSCFVQLKSQAHLKHKFRGPQECFAQFNPGDEDTYKETVEKWSKVYLDMASMVARNLKQDKSGTEQNDTVKNII
eukprot:gnl/MRDRNA2_/MRDRNA2_120418_c0_seq1.p1 gnl/MRDRNA2_/MRDRNA2_120418_c0~~gnl/MRDRNA2_/MRDRNA2_120418_c0_seq1.p1  ORF type:complete len:445 (+),score=78.72 gnl/MRDRNA2_/MRDRNA2_120418_c0_seq1:103-1335(+)